MSYLLANGCSFTDVQCNSGNFYHTEEEKRQLGIPKGNWPMWPSYVGDKLNLLTLNLGKSGQSNYAMTVATISQAYKKKPNIIMHCWTSSCRNSLLGQNLNDINYYHVFGMANLLMKNNINIIDYCKRTPPTYLINALGLIKRYYPDLYEGSVKYYNQLCEEDNNLLKLSDLQKRFVSWQDMYSIDWFMSCWTDWHYSKNKESISEMLITKELLPIIQIYNFCKEKKIKFISVCSHCIESDPGVTHDKLKKFHKTDFQNMNKFETALYGYYKIKKIMLEKWLDNSIFKEIEDKVLSNDFVVYNWPAHNHYTSKPYMDQWLKGFKRISHLDTHPNWDTQKLIGDFFYDLYKKNYA